MFDNGKMLRPRQPATFGPGPIEPSLNPVEPSSSVPAPGLPISESPFPTNTGTTAMSPAPSLTTTTETFPDITFTFTLPVTPSGSSSGTGSSTMSSSSSTPTQSQGTPGPSNPWTFVTPTNATTCEPLQIHWSVSNPTTANLTSTNLALFITNSSAITTNNNIDKVLVTDQPILDTTYTWSAVTVPPGSYIIEGTQSTNGYEVKSSTFTVTAGSNTTCVSSGSEQGSQSGNTSSTTAKGTNVAAIAGGTVGGIVLLACAGVAIFFLCGLRKSPKAKSGRGIRRGWGGLGSVDSKNPRTRVVAPGESFDHLDAGRDSAMGGVAQTRVDSASSIEGEKGARESVGTGAGLPVLTQHSSWSTNIFDTESAGHGAAPRASVELARLPSRPPVPDSPRSSFELSDPFASTPNTNNRRASRTPRKPVPAYNPTPEELDAMAMARSRSDRSQARSTVSQHSSTFSHQPSASYSNTSSSPHGEALLHGLKSKSSGHFDGQPVHYLIPDMPPAPPTD